MSDQSIANSQEEVTVRKKNKMKTKIACYKALDRVYFLPYLKSKAISVNSLRNILLKSENFCCPYKSRINYLGITHSSNYMIKHIHIIANVLAYMETGTVLFFSGLANKEYYEVLISLWNPEIAKRIYHYEFEKDKTERITQPLTGYLPEPKFDNFSTLRNQFVKKPNPIGNTLRNQKALLDNKLLGTEIELRTVDGTKTEFVHTDQHLHYRLRILSNEFQELEDDYSDLKDEFQRKKKVYALQRSLIRLRVPDIVWKAIEKSIPSLDVTVVDDLIKTDLLIKLNTCSYENQARQAAIPEPIRHMSDFWNDLKTNIELQKYMNRNVETYMKNEELKSKKQKRYFEFINKAKLGTQISCENNIAWLLIHSEDEEIEVKTYSTTEMSDEYYMLFKLMPNYFANKELSLQLLANYLATHHETMRTGKIRSNLVDAVITVLIQSLSIDIETHIDKICEQFYNILTIPDCKQVILQHLLSYAGDYPNTLSNSSSYEIMYLSLVRKVIYRLEATSLRVDKILSRLFKLAGESANHATVTLLYDELDQLFAYKRCAVYDNLIEKMKNANVPVPARIEVLIDIMKHSEVLTEAITAKSEQILVYCKNALEWKSATQQSIGYFRGDLASIVAPLESATKVIVEMKEQTNVDATLRALYCMSQLPHTMIESVFSYKAMLELVRRFTELSLSFDWVKNINRAIKVPMERNELINLLALCMPVTSLTRNLSHTDFDELNIIGIASALKAPVQMNEEWATVMRSFFSMYESNSAATYINNIVVTDIECTPLVQLIATDFDGIK